VATISDPVVLATLVRDDPDPRVRAVALAAIVRCAPRSVSIDAWRNAASDTNARVRLRAAQVAPQLGRAVPNTALLALLADDDAWVAEAAAFSLGEHPRPSRAAIDALARAAESHRDALVREAAVAALGAIGDARTLPVMLRACDDKPAIRRRAVLALAAFDGEEVEARLRAALEDRDWQVRQAAEDVLRVTP
jgi:hypothetical protein